MDGGFFPETSGTNNNPNEPQLSQPPPLARQPVLVAPPSSTGCSSCTSLSFSNEWLTAFGIQLCQACQKDEKLISRSNAKLTYSLTDKDLKSLGSIRRSNPHQKSWQKMHLYLERQVHEIAIQKHGSLEALQEHKQAQLDQKILSRVRKREEERKREEAVVNKLKRIREAITTAADAKGGHNIAVDVEEEEI
jgi:DNA repair protein